MSNKIGVPTKSTRKLNMYWDGYNWMYSDHHRRRDKSKLLPAIQIHYEYGRALPSGEIVLLEVKRGVYSHE